MIGRSSVFKKACTVFLSLILVAFLSTVSFSLVSQIPLFLTTSDKPNIAILLDNSGSMYNMMYHPNFPTNCKTMDWYNRSFLGHEDYIFKKGENSYGGWLWDGAGWVSVGNKYFLQNIFNYSDYVVGDELGNITVGGVSRKLHMSSDNTETRYNGAYLNWLYYAASSDDVNLITSDINKTYQKTRLRVAKDTIKSIIQNSYNSAKNSYPYRWGVFTYTYDPSANSPTILGKCSDNKTDVDNMMVAIENVNGTMNTPLGNSLLALWKYFKDTTNGPITSSCQKNFVIAITDGFPFIPDWDPPDNYYSAYGGSDAKSISLDDSDFWINPNYPTDVRYRSKAHIVTKKMHEIPARNGWSDSTIDTFVVGLAFGQDDADNPNLLLNMMASNGGGDSYGASNTTGFTNALNATLNSILSRISSASSVAVNTAFLTSDTKLYRTKFNSGTWSGFLEAFKLNPSDGSVIGYPNSPLWEAGEVLNNRTEARIIYTAGKEPSQNYKRYEFKTDNASTISSLGLNGVAFSNFSSATSSSMVSYVRGDSTPTGYRTRTSKLGDMTYSAPVIAGPPIAYHSSSSYKTFKNTWAGRASLIMVGANDGMLHAFDSTNGQEKWAFIPNTLLPNLKLLRKDPYVHQNYVGGTPTIVDAFIYAKGTDGTTESARSWRTVLVCGLREGGKGYFALDVTNPDNPIPLWEISPSVPSSNGLGYTFGAPLIVKLKAKSNELDGAGDRWVALVPNGYEGTTTGKAASLLVVDLGSGAIVKEIVVDTNTNFVSGHYNGLSSPAAVDINADGLADYVYAGDLKGNLWKFDLRDIDSSKWDVSYRGNRSPGTAYPLFTGYSSQPITTAPDIVLRSGCQVVFFGTGKYYDETVDKADTATQSIYGLYDYNVAKNSPSGSIYGRANLVQQTFTDVIVAGETYRTSSNNSVVPGSEDNMKKGWYVDLWHDGSSPSERIVTDPVAHAKKIIFTTFIPSSAACSYGGTSWLMELNMDTGGTPTKPTFDVNKDNYVNANDVVNDVIPTGYSLRDGISSTPTIVGDKENELKYITKTTGEIVKILEGGATSQFGLRNWRQLR